ncbi:MAG: alpha/beta hydrolase family protein, partial [Verrucomicrobiales bacterium]
WRARFWGHEPAFDLALLAQGYHLAYCDVADLFGSPSALARWDRFYKLSQRLGLHPKPVLEGMSRGGLIIFNWAKANPEKVTAIYADNPVCDIRSWPKDKAPKSWQRCLEVHELRAEDVDKFTGNPIDHLAPLARAEVPLFLVLGAKDRTVPIAENALILEKNYLAHGGSVRKWIKANDAHHPHGLHPPTPLVDAILALTP